MSNPSNQAAQAQTVANALSGEKAFETVRFAITGNPNADAISGIMAVLGAINLASAHLSRARHAAILLEYLAKGYAAEADAKGEDEKRQRDVAGRMTTDPSYPPQSYDYTTTSGTGGPVNMTASEVNERDALRLAQWKAVAAGMVSPEDNKLREKSSLT